MPLSLHRDHPAVAAPSPVAPRRIVIVRAGFALVWAALLVIAVGAKAPHTDSGVPGTVALLLASYPLIDVIASLVSSRFGDTRVLRANAAISALASVGIATAAFGSDAAATLVAFGAWATVSGAIQFGVAIRRRTVAMIVSGGLSTIAGISFIAQSRSDDAHLATLAGYMGLGALLFLLGARRGPSRRTQLPASSFR